MPNWCSNSIEITGEYAHLAVIKASMEALGVMAFLPMPEEVENHRSWAVHHWGTRSEPQWMDLRMSEGSLIVNCDTSWSPCVGVSKDLSSRFPVRVYHRYVEAGSGVWGWYVLDGGELVDKVLLGTGEYAPRHRSAERCDDWDEGMCQCSTRSRSEGPLADMVVRYDMNYGG